MTRFIVTLTEEQRTALDLYRGDHRLKSNAEAVRHWLDGYRSATEQPLVHAGDEGAMVPMIGVRVAGHRAMCDHGNQRSGLDLPLGPPERKPGDLAKKPKGSPPGKNR